MIGDSIPSSQITSGNMNLTYGPIGPLPFQGYSHPMSALKETNPLDLIQKAKECGVAEFEYAGLKVKFDRETKEITKEDNYKERPVPDVKAEEIFKPQSPFEELTPEEILMYATPRFDEIQAEKKAQSDKANGSP